MIETLQHTLGLCGDSHLSFISLFVESQNLNYILGYIKRLFWKI